MVDPNVTVTGGLLHPSSVIDTDLRRAILEVGELDATVTNTRIWIHGAFQCTIQHLNTKEGSVFCLAIYYIPDIAKGWGAPMFFEEWETEVPLLGDVQAKIDEYAWEVPHPDRFVDTIATQFELLIAQSPEQT